MPNNIAADGTNQIANIIEAFNTVDDSGVVTFPAGTIVTDGFTIPEGVAIKGGGRGVTTIKHTGVGSAIIQATGSVTANVATVSANVEPGATSITVLNAGGLAAGDLISLHDSYSYTTTDPTYKSGEMLRVKSVSGNTVNLHGAVFGSWAALDGIYATSNGARISKIDPHVGVNVSDMSLEGVPTLGTGGIRVEWCDKVSLDNVDAFNFGGFGIGINSSRDVSVLGYSARDFTDDVPNGLAGYAIYVKGVSHNVNISGGSVSRVRHGFTTMGSVYGMPHNVNVEGTTLSETTLAALDTHAAGEGIVFTGNTMTGCFQGITSRARKIVIQDNVIMNTYGSHPILLAEENLKDYVIKGNTIFGSPDGSHGFSTRAAIIGLHMVDNIIMDTGADAIFINPASSTVFIARNTTRNVGRGLPSRYHISAGGSGTPVKGGWVIIDNVALQGTGSAMRAVDLQTAGVTGAIVAKNKFSGGFIGAPVYAAGSIVVDNTFLSQAPPLVSGSKAGNAALGSLIAQLAAQGIITNSTT